MGLDRTRNPGYIAMMQKVIAVRGDVLILVGSKAGSTFKMASRFVPQILWERPNHWIKFKVYIMDSWL